MRRYLFAMAALVSFCFAATEAQGEGIRIGERMQGFRPLFSGANLDGWYVRGANPEAFKAEAGVLAVTGAGGGDWLFTKERYANFVLRLEYRIPSPSKPGDEGNSGIAIRTPEQGDPAYAGMEIQVIRPGWEVPWQRAGALYHCVAPEVTAERPRGEWNEVEILCDGPRIRTMLNGKKLYDIKTTDYPEKQDWRLPLTDRPREGHIGLQDHGDRVEYRNIRLRELKGESASSEKKESRP